MGQGLNDRCYSFLLSPWYVVTLLIPPTDKSRKLLEFSTCGRVVYGI